LIPGNVTGFFVSRRAGAAQASSQRWRGCF
jgi:hypothetical protein